MFICFPLVDWGELWKAEWNVASDKCVSSRACHGTSLKQMFLQSFETRSQTESFGLRVLHSNLTCLIHNLLAVLRLMVSCLCDKQQKVMHVCMWHVQLMILAICLGWQNSKVTHSLSGVKRFPQLHYFLYTTNLSNILVIREPVRSHVWYLISWSSCTLHRLIRYSCTYSVRISPTLYGSSALQHFEHDSSVKMRNRLMFDSSWDCHILRIHNPIQW